MGKRQRHPCVQPAGDSHRLTFFPEPELPRWEPAVGRVRKRMPLLSNSLNSKKKGNEAYIYSVTPDRLWIASDTEKAPSYRNWYQKNSLLFALSNQIRSGKDFGLGMHMLGSIVGSLQVQEEIFQTTTFLFAMLPDPQEIITMGGLISHHLSIAHLKIADLG